ncbi:hypothetical protein ACH427_30865 [Streptomyces sp. NPDC020379]|uniref:hypothetical protein n=1 Tax=Streptomyces sp. NPDC020379 TaxID=3365071 RepID=UPI0037A8CEBF
MTAAKGVVGHTMGAAGAIEAARTALTIEHQVVPPAANFHRTDPGTAPLDLVRARPRPQRISLALSNSCGFGGHNAVLALRPATA